MAARLARVDRHAVAGTDAGDLVADLDDLAGDFMAEDHRLAQANRAEAAMQVVMEVGTADAAGADADLDVLRADLGNLGLFDPQIARGMDDGGSHRFSPCSRRFTRRLGIPDPTVKAPNWKANNIL